MISTWIASHATPTLDLDTDPTPARIAALLDSGRASREGDRRTTTVRSVAA